ncbi:bile acid:sodium symporter family protein [Streptomyces sp. NPDC090493]|uniref:bile acid:sodium symporter family protein n=1 Tax=Streptomyces sp. NPDC090493 TaxID=3365964 RepID=UPI003827FBA8
MSDAYTNALLPAALVVIMFGLGLTLTVADLVRVVRAPKAALVALLCQLLVLPAVAYALVIAFGLAPVLAVGMMLLAASPGGPSASLFSHLAGGDVALNVAVTAINSLVAMATFPIITELSMNRFLGGGQTIGLPTEKLVQVMGTVVVPVLLGMWVRRRAAAWADRMRGPVKAGSVVVLAAVIGGAVWQQYQVLVDYAGRLTVITLLFCLCSITVGYFAPRLLRVSRAQAIASAMEIGIHNAVLAITVAITVLRNPAIALPGAVYGILMYIPVALVAYLFTRTAESTQLQGVPD